MSETAPTPRTLRDVLDAHAQTSAGPTAQRIAHLAADNSALRHLAAPLKATDVFTGANTDPFKAASANAGSAFAKIAAASGLGDSMTRIAQQYGKSIGGPGKLDDYHELLRARDYSIPPMPKMTPATDLIGPPVAQDQLVELRELRHATVAMLDHMKTEAVAQRRWNWWQFAIGAFSAWGVAATLYVTIALAGR